MSGHLSEALSGKPRRFPILSNLVRPILHQFILCSWCQYSPHLNIVARGVNPAVGAEDTKRRRLLNGPKTPTRSSKMAVDEDDANGKRPLAWRSVDLHATLTWFLGANDLFSDQEDAGGAMAPAHVNDCSRLDTLHFHLDKLLAPPHQSCIFTSYPSLRSSPARLSSPLLSISAPLLSSS